VSYAANSRSLGQQASESSFGVRKMIRYKLAPVASLAIALAFLGFGRSSSETSDLRDEPAVKLEKGPSEKTEKEGLIVLSLFNDKQQQARVLILNPDGAKVASFNYGDKGETLSSPALSPDRKKLAGC
jgi:hypothetical protein